MSNQSAPSASASDVNHWVHEVITSADEPSFKEMLDDHCAEGYEVVTYSVAMDGQGPIHSALLRRRADGDEHHAIESRRVQRFEAGLDNSIPR